MIDLQAENDARDAPDSDPGACRAESSLLIAKPPPHRSFRHSEETALCGDNTLKRLVKKTDLGTNKAITYTYDGSKLLSIQDDQAGESNAFGYDAAIRLTSVTQGARGTLTYGYDTEDRIQTVNVTSGPSTTYAYNPDGSIRNIIWSPVVGNFGYAYTALGQYDTITFPSGQTKGFSYDDQGRLTQIANQKGATNSATFGYAYDFDHGTGLTGMLGQRTSSFTTFPALAMTGAETKYLYDPLYQLASVRYPQAGPFTTQTHGFTYDDIGNRTTNTVAATTNSYSYFKNPGNPLNGQELQSDGQNTYTYDALGNALTRSGPGGSFTFGYDRNNRMNSITGAASATYAYDYQGRRASKVVNGVTTTYLYDGLNLIGETTNGQTRWYLHGAGIDEPLAVNTGGSTYYLASDGLGSVVATTDASGNVVHAVTYDAWGNPKGETGTRYHSFTYTGRELGEAGLHFYRARFYDPTLGRFTQEDPLVAKNLYAYGLSDPLNRLDPDGQRALTPQDYQRIVAVRAAGTKIGYRERGIAAGEEIKAAIEAVPDGQADPANLRALFWGIDHLGDKDYGRDGTLSKGTIHPERSGDNKCNIFVANAYAIGAGLGTGPNGMPSSASGLGSFLGRENPPTANQWGDPDASIQNFDVVSNPGLGDILSYPNNEPGHQGHTAMYLGGGLLIYAGPNDVKVATMKFLTDNGYGENPTVRRFALGYK